MTTCWIISEGLKGTENQAIALAEEAGLTPEIKNVKLTQPWKTITPYIPFFHRSGFAPGSSVFQAPWPDVIFTSGRKTIAPALWIKKQSGNKAKLIIVLSPVVKNKHFDLVVVPKHDAYKGRSTLEITGAVSLITSQKIAASKIEWENILSPLPGPRIAVLIGGNSRTHKMTEHIVGRLIAQLKHLQKQPASLMITASRRTPENFLRQLQANLSGPNVHFWDGKGANPYIAYLAWADAILVTEDSVSMASEAVSTGKPVYIIKMEGGSKRFARFHDNLVQNNYVRWFDGAIETWDYTPPADLKVAAQAIKHLIHANAA